MLRNRAKYGGTDAVMAIIATENPRAFRPEQLEEIHDKRRVRKAINALTAVA